jgi:hypothetical protein
VAGRACRRQHRRPHDAARGPGASVPLRPRPDRPGDRARSDQPAAPDRRGPDAAAGVGRPPHRPRRNTPVTAGGAPPQVRAAFEHLEQLNTIYAPTTDLLRSFHKALGSRTADRAALLRADAKPRSRNPAGRDPDGRGPHAGLARRPHHPYHAGARAAQRRKLAGGRPSGLPPGGAPPPRPSAQDADHPAVWAGRGDVPPRTGPAPSPPQAVDGSLGPRGRLGPRRPHRAQARPDDATLPGPARAEPAALLGGGHRHHPAAAGRHAGRRLPQVQGVADITRAHIEAFKT